MKIIENALAPLVFKEMQEYILGCEIPWYHHNSVTYPKEKPVYNKDHDPKIIEQTKKMIAKELSEHQVNYNYFSTHMVYHSDRIYSDVAFAKLQPLIELINAKALIRIKINSYPQTPFIVHHQDHVDGNYEHKGALFYVNTNDGLTVMENNTEVTSVENKLVLFDSSRMHHSTTTSNTHRRITININYF